MRDGVFFFNLFDNHAAIKIAGGVMAKVLGVGGVFFKSADPEKLYQLQR